MDPFRLCVALVPLALYFAALGLMHTSRRPRVVTGTLDAAVLALAVSGLIVVGPLELFMPTAAAAQFGIYVWVLLLSFYGLSVSFLILLSRPRLVIYNVTLDELRPFLADVAKQLDDQCRWAGDSLALPQLGVQLHLDGVSAMRSVSLVANGDDQNFNGWRDLERSLRAALSEAHVASGRRGLGLITLAVVLLIVCLVQGLGDRQAMAQGFQDLLRLQL